MGFPLYRGDPSTTLRVTLPCHSEPAEESLRLLRLGSGTCALSRGCFDNAQHDNAILCRPLSFRLRCHPLTFLLFRAHIPSFRTNVRNPPLSVIPSLPRNLFGCCALGRGLALYRGDVSTMLNMTRGPLRLRSG